MSVTAGFDSHQATSQFVDGGIGPFGIKSALRGAARCGRCASVLAGATGSRMSATQSMPQVDKAGEGEDVDLADATHLTHRLVRWQAGSKPGAPLAGLAGPPGQRSPHAQPQLVIGASRLPVPADPPTEA